MTAPRLAVTEQSASYCAPGGSLGFSSAPIWASIPMMMVSSVTSKLYGSSGVPKLRESVRASSRFDRIWCRVSRISCGFPTLAPVLLLLGILTLRNLLLQRHHLYPPCAKRTRKSRNPEGPRT